MTALVILRAGPACTVQDAGRVGYLRYGVTPAGPMDWVQHQTANLLADNPPGAEAIEIGPGGLSVTAEGAALRIGLSAQGFRVRRDGSDLPSRATLVLQPGVRLDIQPGSSGLWACLAVGGGLDAAPVMGSRATHLRSGIGPFGGLALRSGQRLPACKPADDADERGLFEPTMPDRGPIRYVLGPQDDHFTPEAVATLAAAQYTVAARSDRMAYRLSGPALAHSRGHDIVSDGIAAGAIQVPGDGLPLVLMADRQPTGGYPKIACVIRADLPRLAQLRPGQSLRLAPVTVEAAIAALRAATPDPADLMARTRVIRYVRGLGPAARPI
ncbi:MAG: biotin-dependent carboxyltransferase family protein [Gemmobacter sp.]